MLITQKDIRFLRRGEHLKTKWISGRGMLSRTEFDEVLKIRKHFVGLVFKGLKNKKRLQELQNVLLR